MQKSLKALDLQDYCKSFESFLARPKELFLQGDAKVHLRYINALETLIFTPPKEVKNLQHQLALLKKFGFLKLDEIFEFVKIIRYFLYLKSLKCEGILGEWFSSIQIPEQILPIVKSFLEDGRLKSGIYLELDSINADLERLKHEISQQLFHTLNQNKLSAYLVDKQIHLINDEECLLLKAGFHHILKGQILDRSASGFFYVFPQNIANLKDKYGALKNQRESYLFEICREISSIFTKHLLFLKFINKEFDRFDSYQARLNFAKAKNLEFLAPKLNTTEIILDSFSHPALKNPKPITLHFKGQILMITGVNAGGKTMLLKSILSVVFLSKYLIPLPINAAKSSVGNFKHLDFIFEDPQNSKNDISTFGGRMLEFSQILKQRDGIIGVDEIELGTDSDEAASLFKVLLESLMQKNNKIIITTHHKRLAALMASNSKVQLLAALFDKERQMPTFSFLDGTIGKSYAFETALRYGISKELIHSAKTLYGEDKEKLNALIENASRLEMQLKQEITSAQKKSEILEQKIQNLKDKEITLQERFNKLQNSLESAYLDAINAAKMAIKEKNTSDIHRAMHYANTLLNKAKVIQQDSASSDFTPKDFTAFIQGTRVKYRNMCGVILSSNKQGALVELESGMKIKAHFSELKLSRNVPSAPVTKIDIKAPQSLSPVLDLHGMRAEEALEALDTFISNSLIAGFDEVLIYHGIGTGRLSSVVRDFLKTHPKVLEFQDAPPKAGGFGAKIVKI
ncbi:endonuclease MutS2 [Helicobacter turcicus]|uniref:Endonuclease MutS2 n=1 Tax=Helicobacter turcicus TaxID=2867412 RepID=A0ABS7JLB6_9HELI|nr:endonuclease MutS2 [Helicobacter turcicus]MBX7490197.1 endonuclease MutS2 [Helicobacter turcicus]MBX7545224.1 endonuclease MutS2 [Helicobacter turcicus]